MFVRIHTAMAHHHVLSYFLKYYAHHVITMLAYLFLDYTRHVDVFAVGLARGPTKSNTSDSIYL